MDLFAALFRRTSVPIVVFGATGYRIRTVNEAWRHFWDISAASVDGEQLADVLLDEPARLHQQLIDRIRSSGQSEVVSEAAVTVWVNGKPKPRYLTIIADVVSPADQPAGCIGLITTDVTEIVLTRQQADRLAREKEVQTRMMQDALDNSPVAIVITNSIRDQATHQIVDFEYLLANRESDRLSNLPPGERLTGRRLLETFPGDVDSGIFAQFCQVVETGESLFVESHYQHGPTDRWFYIRTVRHGDGFIQTILDITPVKEAEAAVQRQSDLLRTILDNSQTAISLHNAIRDETSQIVDFKTILANRRAYTMWGDEAEQVVNQTFMALRPDARSDFDRYVGVVEQGIPARFDFNLNNRLYSINVARAGDGVVLSSVDITSDRQYQQQLEQINAELKRSNENLQAFAYIASHDLQEPLRKISSFSSILTDQYNAQLNRDGQDILRRMRVAAERMSALIRDLLAYARIGSQPEPFQPVDLQPLLHELIDDMDLDVDPMGATVQLGFLPQVPGDRVLLRQLFQNLVSNALKFRRSGVSPIVQIDSERVPTNQLPPSLLNRSGGYWIIRVADNGIGFANEYADRIFQVFQRLHGHSQYNGTGIGLAIVRKVAEQHGGLVVAESQPGIGATFSIYLPA